MTMLASWRRAILWLAVAFTLVMACIPVPPQMPGGLSDKLQHAGSFAVITLLAYPEARPRTVLILLLCFGVAIEWLQALPMIGRDSSLFDVFADLCGILAALGLWRWLRLRGDGATDQGGSVD